MSNRHVGKRGRAKHLLGIFFLVAALALSARPAAAGTLTVMWDLMTDARVTGYRVFVGTSSGHYTQAFDLPANTNFFIFRNAFTGVRYYFAVAGDFEGTGIGDRSLEVSGVGTRTVGGGSLPDDGRGVDPLVAPDCRVDCFVVSEVARGLGAIGSLAVANDGTIFAVEDGRRVLALHGNTRSIAFEAPSGTTLRHIALDPQFDSTGRVFLSLLRPRDQTSGGLEILRLRYLAGTLAEPATLVGGISVPLGAAAPLAVGDNALVYVALPALIARHPYSAAVLAFDQDGRVPKGQSSLVVGGGLANPVGLIWDRQGRTIWLSGSNAGEGWQVKAAMQRDSVWSASRFDDPVAALSAATEGRTLLIAAGLDLVELTVATGETVRISLEDFGSPIAAASDADGTRVIAVRRESAAGPTCSVLRIMNVLPPNLP